MQQNGKIDDKFQIVNPIYEDKNFAKDPLEIRPKTCNDNLIFQRNQSILHQLILNIKNSNNDNYSDILSDKSFTDEHSDDPIIQIKLHLTTKLL